MSNYEKFTNNLIDSTLVTIIQPIVLYLKENKKINVTCEELIEYLKFGELKKDYFTENLKNIPLIKEDGNKMCSYTFKKGTNIGKKCKKFCIDDQEFCIIHKNHEVVTTDGNETEEEILDEKNTKIDFDDPSLRDDNDVIVLIDNKKLMDKLKPKIPPKIPIIPNK